MIDGVYGLTSKGRRWVELARLEAILLTEKPPSTVVAAFVREPCDCIR